MEEIWYTPEERLPELGDKVIYIDKITKETKHILKVSVKRKEL